MLSLSLSLSLSLRARVCVCVHVRVRARVRACARLCVCVLLFAYFWITCVSVYINHQQTNKSYIISKLASDPFSVLQMGKMQRQKSSAEQHNASTSRLRSPVDS